MQFINPYDPPQARSTSDDDALDTPEVVASYQSVRGIGFVVSAILLVIAFGRFAQVYCNREYARLLQIDVHAEATLEYGDDLDDLDLACDALIGVAAILFFVWLYRAYRNLRALGAKELAASPFWVVMYYALPVLNLFVPCQNALELCRHSAPRQHGLPTFTLSLIRLWWLGWLLAICMNVVSQLNIDRITMAAYIIPASHLLSGVTALLAAVWVHRIGSLQTDKFAAQLRGEATA